MLSLGTFFKRNAIYALLAATVFTAGGCGDDEPDTIPVAIVTVSGDSSLLVGETTTVSALLSPADATDQTVTWSSSNTAVATVDASGVVRGISAGAVAITARANDGTGVTGAHGMTVSDAPIAVSGISITGPDTIQTSTTVTLEAVVTPSNATDMSLSWSSSNEAVATVDSSGAVTGVGPGVVAISATADDGSGVTATHAMNVSDEAILVTEISVTGAGSIDIGNSVALTVEVTPINASDTSITWSSSDTAVATVDNDGYVTGVSAGVVAITASANDASGVTGAHGFTVTEQPILVTGMELSGPPSLQVGSSATLTATATPENAADTSVTWLSSDVSVASADSVGSVMALAEGSVTITATANDGSGVSASHVLTTTAAPVLVTSITLSGASNVEVSGTTSISADIQPSSATNNSVTWSSSNTAVATVSSNGTVSGVGAGSTTITASANDSSGVTGSHPITVTSAVVLVSSVSLSGASSVDVAATISLTATVLPETATDSSLTWSSSDTAIATVSASGAVTGVSAGTAVVTATANDSSSTVGSKSITVNSASTTTLVSSISLSGVSSLDVDATATLSASVLPSNATDSSLTWSSSDTSIATVDSSGTVTGISAGSVTITAAANDGSGVTGSHALSVNAPVSNSVGDFDITITQDGGTPGWGTVTILLTYTGTPSLNMRNAKITFTSPFGVSSVWGGAVSESTSGPTFSASSSAADGQYSVEVTYELGEDDWVDSTLDNGQSFQLKFSPAELVELSAYTVISVEAEPIAGGGAGSLPPVLADPVDLYVPGWGNCLAMGTVSNGSTTINQALADSMTSVIYKYAGPGGNGDRGQIVEPSQTIATIAQARAVEALTGNTRTILPVMVVYTAEASGGGAAEFDIIYTGEAEAGVTPTPNSENLKKHYINLIRIAKTLQAAKDEAHPSPGSIVLNPDLMGAWQQNEATQFNTNYRNEDGTFRTIVIKSALQEAIDWVQANDGATAFDPSSIPSSIVEDVTGFVQSQNFLIRQYAPDVTFGWQINLWAPGSSLWIHNRYSGQQELWENVSSTVTNFFDTLGVHSGDWSPDFVTFDKYERDGLGNQARGVGYAYNSLDWENYLAFVKQVTDHYSKPALLWQIPGGHMPTTGESLTNYDVNAHGGTGGPYFMGDKLIGTDTTQIDSSLLATELPGVLYNGATNVQELLNEDPTFDWGKQRLRQAAASNAFAILWGGGSTTSVVDIGTSGDDDGWLVERIQAYYNYGCMKITNGPSTGGGDSSVGTEISGNTELDSKLIGDAVNTAFNTEVFLAEQPDTTWAPSSVYRWEDFLVALKKMHIEGIGADYKYWLGGTSGEEPDAVKRAQYGLVNIAAFLAQGMKETIKYDACDENNWSYPEHWDGDTYYPMTSACGQLGQDYEAYGLDGDGNERVESCPKTPKAEMTAVTNARWYGAPGPLFAAPDSAMIYAGVSTDGSSGYWNHNGSQCTDIPEAAGAGQAFHRQACHAYAGQKAGGYVFDGSAGSLEGCVWWGRGVIQTTGRYNFGLLNHYLGRSHLDITDATIRANFPIPSELLYPDLDFCTNPELVCTSAKHPELKWIAGLFYWMSEVQTYSESGWVYFDELKSYVDGGFSGNAFIDSVSGIVNRGCHNPPCGTGPLDGGLERRENFEKVLQAMGLME